jgi:hypothetical protein
MSMAQPLKIVSLVALALTLLPSALSLGGSVSLEGVKTMALVGTVVWFAVTPLWMGRARAQ